MLLLPIGKGPVDIPGHDVEVWNMRAELKVLTQDSHEGTTGQYRDIAIWEPDQKR